MNESKNKAPAVAKAPKAVSLGNLKEDAEALKFEPRVVQLEEFRNISMGYEMKPCSVEFVDPEGKESIFKFNCRYALRFSDVMRFTDEVAAVVYNIEDGTYLPMALDFAFKKNVILCYTDIKLEDEVEDQYYFLYTTQIVKALYDFEMVNTNQIAEMMSAIKEMVDYNKKYFINTNEIRLSTAIEKLTDLTSKMDAIFSGVDINNLTETLSEVSGLDEKKLVKAILSEQKEMVEKDVFTNKEKPKDKKKKARAPTAVETKEE